MDEWMITRQMLQFIEESPTAFHAAANAEKLLREEGFVRLEKDSELRPGGRFYAMQNGSALIAVKLPEGQGKGVRIVASHSDSPCFKLKETPEIRVEGKYVKLNTEKYGGMILSTWLDRPLSVAGRIFVKEEDGSVACRLVDLKKDLLVIPNVAIHFNREINEGYKYNPQTDLAPLMGTDQELNLTELCAHELGVPAKSVLGSDLYVYNRDKGRIMGADDSLIGSPRLDDLQCAYSTLRGFLASRPKEYVAVYALFDNEEVGSGTKQGADSTFLEEMLEIVLEALGVSESTAEKRAFLQNSFLLSADNGHAVHPNHPEKSDPTNRPCLNGGVVLKYNGSQKYTTDGYSAAVVRDICRTWQIPLQTFANRSDIPGGSTLGNISTAHVSIPSADVGLAQLAMHSAFETAGVKDTAAMEALAEHIFC
ncbi:MAG: M18 family aminopeptidase [Eubacteriales bacterium]|nr:M18 family aminopeptidase [Eubacteriales bacterium]